MKIAFRVDASPQIGTGHLARCLTLADALRAAGADTRLICRHVPDAMAQMVKASGHALTVLPPGNAPAGGTAHAAWLGTSQEEDADATVAALAAPCDWLVLDHYALDQVWENALRPLARRILVIDDLADRRHACDVLLDQNMQPQGGNRYDGLLPQHCRALIGPRYALLRPEFRDAVPRKGENPVRRINIFFGGIDAAGMTLRALNEIAPFLEEGIAIDVVAGAGNPQLAAVRQRCDTLGAVLHVQSGEIAKLFAAADLGLGAGGATSWERCRMGLPTIVVSVADNQHSGCAALAEQGAAIWLGDVATLRPGALREAVAVLAADAPARVSLEQRSQALVDGRGTERVLLHMMRDQVTLRLAGEGDGQRAWLWRNDPHTRRFSIASTELDWESHRDWWQASLHAPDRDLLVASCGGTSFGILRFDHRGDAATVSIYLDPELNGLGLGSAALRAGNDWIAQHRGARTLAAHILPINEQSQRSFAAAGYRRTGTESWTRTADHEVTETRT